MATNQNVKGRGGRGNTNNRGGRGRGRGKHPASATAATKHKGLCAALGVHVFDYGQKGAADQMRITWEKISHHVGTIYGSDISNELINRTKFIITPPKYSEDVIIRNAERKDRFEKHQERLQSVR